MDDINYEYFTSYEDLEIHKLMLEDVPRTEAYKKAILGNKTYFKDKIVMDVGCGMGILSIFCAQAGAKKVYAIEASNLANVAKDIVMENNFENVIEVIQNKVEDVDLPDVKVDAIVSEWMGFHLLHEGMLDSVLIARDKFLKPGGAMFPENAIIYVAPCSVPTLFDKWKDMYGVCLSTFSKHLRSEKNSKPVIMEITEEDLLGSGEAMAWINLNDYSIHDLDHFDLQHIVGANRSGLYQGICIWFECTFPQLSSESPIVLSTGPESPVTHWKQTIVLLPEEQLVEEQEPICFNLNISRDQDHSRRYNLQLTLLDPEEAEHPIPCTCYMTKCILLKTVMQQEAENTIQAAKKNVLQEDRMDDDSDD